MLAQPASNAAAARLLTIAVEVFINTSCEIRLTLVSLVPAGEGSATAGFVNPDSSTVQVRGIVASIAPILDGEAVAGHATDSHVKNGRQQYAEDRRRQHAARYAGADGATRVGACTAREHQRQDAEDEGERS